jgi:hypothetical protein
VTELYPDFLDKLSIIAKDVDGACFKYVNSKGHKYYCDGQRIQSLPAFQYFFNLIGETIDDVSTQHTNIYFEFHPGAYTTLGQIQTDYGFSISEFVNGILEKKLKLNDVFLPLMFLFRHYIELSLKANLKAVEDTVYDIEGNHSLYSLFSKFKEEVNNAIPHMDEQTNTQMLKFQEKFNELKQIIHDVDAHSMTFRYPVDKYGKTLKWKNVKQNFVIDVFTLATTANAYISLAIPILQHYGYLPSNQENT